MEIQGKVAVVTGGAQGIGLVTAKMFADRGAKVVIMDFNKEALDAAEQELPGEVLALECDVANEASVEAAFRKVGETFGRLDIAVLNAGILRDGLLVKADRETGKVAKKMSLAQWSAVIDTNLTGVFLTGREAAAQMIDLGTPGVIIPISSIARHGNMGQTNYSAAKAGVAVLCVVWGRELSRHGIRVNGVSPGFIATPMVKKDMKPEMLERFRKMIPIGRLGESEEIADAIRYVVENDLMCATVLEPSGGMSL